ncbi:hypothetical protein ACJX0J_031956 [Zea mays]
MSHHVFIVLLILEYLLGLFISICGHAGVCLSILYFKIYMARLLREELVEKASCITQNPILCLFIKEIISPVAHHFPAPLAQLLIAYDIYPHVY